VTLEAWTTLRVAPLFVAGALTWRDRMPFADWAAARLRQVARHPGGRAGGVGAVDGGKLVARFPDRRLWRIELRGLAAAPALVEPPAMRGVSTRG
jgi:hypothetical protein